MKTLDTAVVDEIAESMLEEGQLTPILVRADGERYVLIEGLHRLEACKALGEETVEGMVVQDSASLIAADFRCFRLGRDWPSSLDESGKSNPPTCIRDGDGF